MVSTNTQVVSSIVKYILHVVYPGEVGGPLHVVYPEEVSESLYVVYPGKMGGPPHIIFLWSHWASSSHLPRESGWAPT